MAEYDDLVIAAKAFPDTMKKHLMFISKGGFSTPVRRRAEDEGTVLLTAEDLFAE